ncbi:MAG: quinolinate synthase NadA [Candidatus Methanoplasma sp.]|jgi:quinolinate synthase|nr:quinolinate synthase NadA [Candidatus Methanoplasma sp.]
MSTVTERILQLKKEKNAVILAHNYTSSDIQDAADYVGDSLGLSIRAAESDADVIVFCGVSFMGETAKILSPEKTVLLPEPEARCAMASMCNAEQIRHARQKNPGAAVVGYVNSTAESKCGMDICCTSSNAVAVVNSLKQKDVIFAPDMNLGAYVASKTDKNIILWDGFCPVHQSITVRQVCALKEMHPGAKILAHPECRPEVLALADGIGSTEKMLAMAGEVDSEDVIILTEVGMRHRLEALHPLKRFHFPIQAVCMTMKMIELESVVNALETFSGEVVLDPNVLKGAYASVKRMIELRD